MSGKFVHGTLVIFRHHLVVDGNVLHTRQMLVKDRLRRPLVSDVFHVLAYNIGTFINDMKLLLSRVGEMEQALSFAPDVVHFFVIKA